MFAKDTAVIQLLVMRAMDNGYGYTVCFSPYTSLCTSCLFFLRQNGQDVEARMVKRSILVWG